MAGYQPIDGIRPVPPVPSLLTVARLLPAPGQPSPGQDPGAVLPEGAVDPGPFWRSGVSWLTSNCRTGYGWPNRPPSGDDALEKEPPAEPDTPQARPYMLYLPLLCEWVPRGDEDRYGLKADVIAGLEAVTAYHVAHELWTGDIDAMSSDGLQNDTLQSAAVSVGVSAAAHPIWALGRLIEAFEECAQHRDAILHVPSILIPFLQNQGVISQVGDALRTSLGVPVSPGPGYPVEGATGPGGAEAGEGEAWVYISGRVEYALSAPVLLPAGDAPPRMDRRMNRYEVWAERKALTRFDPCCVFAVRVAIPNAPSEAS